MSSPAVFPFEPPKAKLAGDIADRWRSKQPHAKAARVFRALGVIPGTFAVISIAIAGADLVAGHHNNWSKVVMYTIVFFAGPASLFYAIAYGLISKQRWARLVASMLAIGMAVLVPVGAVIGIYLAKLGIRMAVLVPVAAVLGIYLGMQLRRWELPEPSAVPNRD